MPTLNVTIEFKEGTAADWASKNPVLRAGEPGQEIDTGKFKLGNGVSAWSDLEYFIPGAGGAGGGDLQSHIDSPLPHPIYDDGPSLELLYQNAKV